jgi:hypothetical protein
MENWSNRREVQVQVFHGVGADAKLGSASEVMRMYSRSR